MSTVSVAAASTGVRPASGLFRSQVKAPDRLPVPAVIRIDSSVSSAASPLTAERSICRRNSVTIERKRMR